MKNNLPILLLGPVFALSVLFSCQSTPKMPEPGATLYTVRNQMDEDARGTLQAVANVGYVNIEATNYADGKFYGMEPAAFKSYLESLGLNPLSVHQGGVTLDNADQMIADSKAAGFRYFVIPIPPMGHFQFDPATRTMSMSGTVEEVTDIINTIGAKCKAAGLELLYHNHDFEFKPNADGVVPIEYFLEHTDPEVVNFQMDLYWVTRAGADPLDYFEKYPGRFKIWHVKDMDEQGRFAPVGTGQIDFARILAQKEQSGMEYFIVEQDMTFDGMEPLQAIQISFDNLKTLGFR
ncbi:sugar phosphate isomerase/epimerase [Robiginitalea sp. M366]|uniref:sugar phosphate isomerase/epimerase family protein n=1 Tax=Robiginitalea aestuariiviva TaxID=3036903 RepID=UPI00240D7323|nr:sugar phosphate isomerase/epimerase [Robiginitalea aestuariiviva]MDG1572658.1 sugar phosphate isomerase/epimerase [Robiginitalea aestuariiviva]